MKLYDTYEEREYSNSTWAFTTISSLIMEPAQMRGFKVRRRRRCGPNVHCLAVVADA